MIKIGFFLLLGVISAFAKDLTVNDQDQGAILQICDAAAASPPINRDMRAGIANWCVAWEKRMNDAKDAKAEPPKDKP